MKHGSHKIIFIFLCSICFKSYSAPIEGNSVILQILDKITSEINTIEIDVNDFYNYESLKIEIYACYKSPPEEVPEDFVLLKIIENIKKEDKNEIFQGWMISSSPSVTAFEHPIYDLWLKECKVLKNF